MSHNGTYFVGQDGVMSVPKKTRGKPGKEEEVDASWSACLREAATAG